MDSHLASVRTETLNKALAGVSGFPFAANFIAEEFSQKVGWIANPDRFPGIEIELFYEILKKSGQEGWRLVFYLVRVLV